MKKVKKIVFEYYYILLTLFFLLLAILLNMKIKKHHKLTLLLVALLFGIYEPKLIIPFFISILIVFNFNKSRRLKNNIETFEDEIKKEDIKQLKNDLINSEKITTNVKLIKKVIKNPNIFIEKLKEEERSFYKTKIEFIKELNSVPFFNIENNKDKKLIINLSKNYLTVEDLRETFNFSEFISDEGFDDDEFRVNKDDLIKDKNYKILGLFYHKNKSRDLQQYIVRIIKEVGLYSLFLDVDYLKKDLLEFSLMVFFYQFQIKQKLNYNSKFILHDNIDMMNIFDKNPNGNIILKEISIKLNKIFSSDLIFKNRMKDGKYIIYKLLFNYNDFQQKLIDNDDYSNTSLIENYDKNLENYLNLVFDFILENIDILNINLLNPKYYRIVNKRKKKSQDIRIIKNFTTLMLFSNSLEFAKYKIEDISEKGELLKKVETIPKSINELYNNLKKLYDRQITDGEKMDDIYYFSSKKNIMYDSLFHFISKITTTEVKNIFPIADKYIEEIVESSSPSITDEILEEQISTYEKELNEELGLIDEEEVNNTELDKYYDMLNKEKEVKLESLSRFAQEKNKKDKIEKHSFDNVIDNFGEKVYEMIDSLIELFTDFFSSSSNSPSPSSSDKPTYKKAYKLSTDVLDILLEKDNALYSGTVLVILALFIYFIDSNTKVKAKPKSIFDLLSL